VIVFVISADRVEPRGGVVQVAIAHGVVALED